PVRAIEGVTFDLHKGRTLGLVGESGSGKSLTALSIMRLLPDRIATIASGSIRYAGTDLARADEAHMRDVRGNAISMVFQEPMTSLNPVLTIGDQIIEVILTHRAISRVEARRIALDLLDRVNIAGGRERLMRYPHQLSGGMRQRVMIAIALACEPDVLIADEPTTALDVTIQAGILDLIDELRAELDAAVLLITHDLAVVAERADTLAVMYAGEVIETGPAAQVLASPQHPYTIGLLGSIPTLDDAGAPLVSIAGTVPAAGQSPDGCRFHPRCPLATAPCRSERPLLQPLADGQGDGAVACLRAPIDALAA
ncbi:MAG: ABC transporter ATP-binding protein, partial [Pseudomonadota bacterium]